MDNLGRAVAGPCPARRCIGEHDAGHRSRSVDDPGFTGQLCTGFQSVRESRMSVVERSRESWRTALRYPRAIRWFSTVFPGSYPRRKLAQRASKTALD